MPFRAVPFTVEVKLKGDHGGDPRITVLHYRYSTVGTPPTVPELTDLCHAVRVGVLAPLKAMVTGGTRWTSISARDINNVAGNYSEISIDPVEYGTRPGETHSGNTQLCLTKKSILPMRRGTGRIFVPDLSEADVNDSQVSPQLQSLALQLAAALLANRGSIRNFVPVVASKKYQIFSALAAIAFDLITDSLRTRLKNHRRKKRRTTNSNDV